MELEIEVFSGQEAGRVFNLAGPGPFFAGSSPECDVLIRDPSISPVHGTFQATGEGFLYIDSGSEQGSFRDSDKIDRVMLTGTVRLKLGTVEIGIFVVPSNGQRQEERIVFCENCSRIFPLNVALASGQKMGEPAVCPACMEGGEPSPERVPGFALGEIIEKTPLAAIYSATEAEGGREVLLDLFGPAGVSTREALARVVADIETLREMKHPAVCPPGTVREAGDFFVRIRDKIPGGTLAEKFASIPATQAHDEAAELPGTAGTEITASGFTFEQVVALVRILANVLDSAHSHNILHRDMRPRNVVLSAQGDVWLDGLGLAKHFQLAGGRGSERQILTTEPAYQAPELLRDPHNVGPRADVYSLGAIGYQLITGRPPFETDDTDLLFEMIRIEPPPPVSTGAAGLALPETLDSVFSLALAKLPKDRYATARDFAEAFAQAFGFPPEI